MGNSKRVILALQDLLGRERLTCFCPHCGAKMDLEDEDE